MPASPVHAAVVSNHAQLITEHADILCGALQREDARKQSESAAPSSAAATEKAITGVPLSGDATEAAATLLMLQELPMAQVAPWVAASAERNQAMLAMVQVM